MTFKIRLIPDRYHLHDIGKLESGAFCWITLQLHWDGEDTRDFVATYIFDADGRLIQHIIDDLGLRSGPSGKSAKSVIAEHKRLIGPIEPTDIWVSPFSVSAYGLEFGLIERKLDPDDDPEYLEKLKEDGPLVDAMPGHTLMFYPPWDEGLYDS